jgi:hypothetical protein
MINDFLFLKYKYRERVVGTNMIVFQHNIIEGRFVQEYLSLMGLLS